MGFNSRLDEAEGSVSHLKDKAVELTQLIQSEQSCSHPPHPLPQEEEQVKTAPGACGTTSNTVTFRSQGPQERRQKGAENVSEETMAKSFLTYERKWKSNSRKPRV